MKRSVVPRLLPTLRPREKARPATSSRPLRLVTQAVRAHPTLLAAALTFRIVWELLPMQVPAVVGWLVDGLSMPEPRASWLLPDVALSQTNLILVASAALLGIGLLQALSAWASTEVSARLGLAVVTRIRSQVFRRILSPVPSGYESGDLLSRALHDTARVKGFVDRVFVRSVTTGVRAVFPIVMLFVIDVRLAALTLLVLPLQQGLSHILQQRMQRASRAASAAHARLTSQVQTRLAGLASIHALGAEDACARRLDQFAEELEARELESSRLLAGVKGVVWVCTSLGTAIVWLTGSQAVIDGRLSLGTLITFAGYATFVFRPFRQMTNVLKTYRTGLASVERIVELMERRGDSGEDGGEASGPPLGLQSWLRGPTGFHTLFGNQGCGKSKTLRALARTTRDTNGTGAYIPEAPTILEGTLECNLRLASSSANHEELREAAALAGLEGRLEHAFSEPRERDDLATRRRVALAQAILRSRGGPIFFDEPTSGLDEPSAEAILESLVGLARTRYVLSASHDARVSRRAEMVWQMDHAGRTPGPEGQVV